MYYAVGRIDLQVPGCRSLKEKRSVVARLKARLSQRLHGAVGEVGHQDLLQRAALGVAFVVSSPSAGSNALAAARREIEDDPRVVVLAFDTHVAALGDETAGYGEFSWGGDDAEE